MVKNSFNTCIRIHIVGMVFLIYMVLKNGTSFQIQGKDLVTIIWDFLQENSSFAFASERKSRVSGLTENGGPRKRWKNGNLNCLIRSICCLLSQHRERPRNEMVSVNIRKLKPTQNCFYWYTPPLSFNLTK